MFPLMLLVHMLVAQSGVWRVSPETVTVGDTITITAEFTVPPENDLKAPSFESSDLFQLLEMPELSARGNTVMVTYRMAFFVQGEHTITLPALEVLDRSGSSDSIAAGSVTVHVASVLPAGDSLPEPKGSRSPIARPVRKPEPLVAFMMAALALTAGWGVLRRRKRTIPAPVAVREVVKPDLASWIASGEPRAVASVVAERLREFLAGVDPGLDRSLSTEECIAVLEQTDADLPVRELTGLLRTLDRARFAPAVASEVEELVRRVDEVMGELEPAGTEESGAS